MAGEKLIIFKNLVLLLFYSLFLSGSAPEAKVSFEKEGSLKSDVTSRLENLGQPFLKAAYARNVWDMQVFEGKIYVGYGNSSNEGPSANAGPIPIYYYDPITNKFDVQEVISSDSSKRAETKKYVDEEQIDIFKVLNGKLYVPGNDSREGWKFGNYYKLDHDKWIKYRNIPNGVHVYDMAYYDGKLFVSVGTSSTADVLMSEDDGVTWTKIGAVGGKPGRAYTLFEFKKNLYAVSAIPAKNNKWPDEAKILSIKGDTVGGKKPDTSQVTVYGSEMLPGITKQIHEYMPPPYMKMVRTTVVNDKLLYIAGEIVNDGQWTPRGLVVADDLNDARQVALPNPDALPMDILVRNHTIYVLTYTSTSPGKYTNTIYKANSNNLTKWTELLEFKQDTFARSFEELNGDFYFGLGSDTDVTPESTGRILRIRNSAVEN
ncbi:hypothetical protein [Paenibacillus sp. SI8]|uniref:hypothetical protein n=1 Tax=unclassified Paenibacillus TaxID=185978 RepID=UPI003467E9A4